LNLAFNARDAMPEGGTLSIATASERATRGSQNATPSRSAFVTVTVTDTGHGMTPEVLEHAFEPLFTTKEAGGGTGLGLSMVYGFAKQSGGHVRIESEVGQGTAVTLYLPDAEGHAVPDAFVGQPVVASAS
jgi:signal transduction histidine kinase